MSFVSEPSSVTSLSPPCLDFGSLFDLEHDLPDELISSSDLGLINGGDAGQLHGALGGIGGGQDAAAKHKQLSELLRAGAPGQQGGLPSNSTAAGASMGMMAGVGGPQGMACQGQQPQPGLMQQAGMVGGVAALSRAAAMMGAQKGNAGPQQGLMGGQVMNGSPRMGYPGGNSTLLADPLQQHGPQQIGPGGQTGMRPQQPGSMSKVSNQVMFIPEDESFTITVVWKLLRCRVACCSPQSIQAHTRHNNMHFLAKRRRSLPDAVFTEAVV